MRFDLDTEIRYPTGELAGMLRKVILDENGDAKNVVMATDEIISRKVLVPTELLNEDPGGVLTINATPDQVDTLNDYEEQRLPAAPDEWEPSDDYAPGGDVFPATMYQPIIPVVEVSNTPEGTISLSQGTEVWCLDGRWGIVDEVIVDDAGHVTTFVARPDAMDEHDRIVPISLVREVTPDAVTLNCTLDDLPAYTEETVMEQEEPEPR